MFVNLLPHPEQIVRPIGMKIHTQIGNLRHSYLTSSDFSIVSPIWEKIDKTDRELNIDSKKFISFSVIVFTNYKWYPPNSRWAMSLLIVLRCCSLFLKIDISYRKKWFKSNGADFWLCFSQTARNFHENHVEQQFYQQLLFADLFLQYRYQLSEKIDNIMPLLTSNSNPVKLFFGYISTKITLSIVFINSYEVLTFIFNIDINYWKKSITLGHPIQVQSSWFLAIFFSNGEEFSAKFSLSIVFTVSIEVLTFLFNIGLNYRIKIFWLPIQIEFTWIWRCFSQFAWDFD